MANQAPRVRERKKTWTAFGNIARKPTDYEIVTHNMNHTMGELPLEVPPSAHGNVWLTKYRDQVALKVSDWDKFRDPDRQTYDTYVKMQDDQETYIDNLLVSYTQDQSSDETLSGECLTLLATALTPCRYLGHAQQMVSAYIQQLAPSSYVGNCAVFQTSDQLRRVQRIAYRTKQLANTHPTRGFGDNERKIWETDARWQPIRKAMENLLVEFEWDKSLAANNLVIRPICDDLFLNQLGNVLREAGDELDALILKNLYADAQRHNHWTTALVQFAVGENPANRAVFRDAVAKWTAMGEEVIKAGAGLVAGQVAGEDAAAIANDVRQNLAAHQAAAGLGRDA